MTKVSEEVKKKAYSRAKKKIGVRKSIQPDVVGAGRWTKKQDLGNLAATIDRVKYQLDRGEEVKGYYLASYEKYEGHSHIADVVFAYDDCVLMKLKNASTKD